MNILKTKLLIATCLLLTGMPQLKAQTISPEEEDTTKSTLAKLYNDMELFKKLKITGYIQVQALFSDSSNLGSSTTAPEDKRMQIRRGRIKFNYESGLNQIVFQADITERGFRSVDAYAKITDPWINWFSLKGGLFDRPFGYEIAYSSSVRETPERGRMSPTLFPNERDFGAAFIIQGPKTGRWNWIKAEMAMVAGVGGADPSKSANDFDKMKDFIGHLSINRTNRAENLKYGLGASLYHGGIVFNNDTSFTIGSDSNGVKGYIVDKHDQFDFAKREYYGFDAQASYDWALGATTIRAEYIAGTQPGVGKSSKSAADLPADYVYSRHFDGAYFYFIQNITKLKSQIVVKYDWFDPNTDVTGDEVGKTVTAGTIKTNEGDIKYHTLGAGLNYFFDEHTKLCAYYEMNTNETSENLSKYSVDLHDNLFTLRMQYKF